jgi:hypothetical protein
MIEKAIVSMNSNPFHNQLVAGRYSLQVREEYFAGEMLKSEGVSDTIVYRIFNGKFKLYSENEKSKGKDWIIDQNEIAYGIKDSSGIYSSPDEYAQFKLGADSLRKILESYSVYRSETDEDSRRFLFLMMEVNEKGLVNIDNMSFFKPVKSNTLLNKIKKDSVLMANWYPAVYKGRSVKSKVNLPILIKD